MPEESNIEEEKRREQERLRLVKGTGLIPRLADAAEQAKASLLQDQGKFQREHGTALLAAYDRIPKGSDWPANLGRLPDDKLNALDDYGEARGFLKVNPDHPGNLYEALERPAENRPAERLAKKMLDVKENLYDQVKRERSERAAHQKAEERSARERSHGRDEDGW